MARNFYPYYEPSQAAAGVACALFAIGLAVSLYQTIRHRGWIWFIMLLAIAMEAVGYGARIVSAGDVTARIVFIVQYCLVFLAPVIMAGIIYVVFGRIVFLVIPPESRTIRILWVPARWLTLIFVGFDVFALFLQLVGSVMLVGTQVTDANYLSKINTGKTMATAGVYLQLAAFGIFTFIAVRFHFVSRRFIGDLARRYQSNPGDKSITIPGAKRSVNPKWEHLLYVLNGSCGLILVRSIYREVDFSLGVGSSLAKYEYIPYILDALPMFLLVVMYTLCPPGAYVSMGWRQPKQETARMVLESSDGGENANAFRMVDQREQV